MEETILTHIRAEHGFIEEALKLTADSGPELREELYTIARQALVNHMHSEETSFYKKLHDEDENAIAIVEQLESEHQEVKDTLQKLNLMDIKSDEWLELFNELREKVKVHCMQEEAELFPEAKEDYSLEELVDMVSDFEEAKHSNRSVIFYV